MNRCAGCGTHLSDDRTATRCPSCGTPLVRPVDDRAAPDTTPVLDGDDLVVVAVAANLAEAGYFQDVLAAHGVPAQLEPATDPRSGRVTLAVPEGHAARAASLLTEEASERGKPDVPAWEFQYPGAARVEKASGDRFWEAIIIAGLIALTACLVLGLLSEPA